MGRGASDASAGLGSDVGPDEALRGSLRLYFDQRECVLVESGESQELRVKRRQVANKGERPFGLVSRLCASVRCGNNFEILLQRGSPTAQEATWKRKAERKTPRKASALFTRGIMACMSARRSSAVSLLTGRALLPSFVNSMCELPAESLSDTEEVEAPNILNALSCVVTNFQLGTKLEALLTEEELGRVELEHVLSLNSQLFLSSCSAG